MYWPEGQFGQLGCPLVLVNLPTAQAVQLPDAAALVVPAGQLLQANVSPVENCPAAQLVHALWPDSWLNEPATQLMHDDALASEYEPGAHGVHSPPEMAY